MKNSHFAHDVVRKSQPVVRTDFQAVADPNCWPLLARGESQVASLQINRSPPLLRTGVLFSTLSPQLLCHTWKMFIDLLLPLSSLLLCMQPLPFPQRWLTFSFGCNNPNSDRPNLFLSQGKPNWIHYEISLKGCSQRTAGIGTRFLKAANCFEITWLQVAVHDTKLLF